MAKTLAFWKTHVLDKPAALSILNNTPALVGAENLLTKKSSFQISYSDPTLGSAYLYYTATNIHGKQAVVAAIQ